MTIPFVVPKRGMEYTKVLDSYLKKIGLRVTINKVPMLKRLIIKNKKKILRINFVLFEGRLKSDIKNYKWKPIIPNSLLHELTN